LVGAPEHNGCVGTVVRYREGKGRYLVRLDDSGAEIGVRPANLSPAPTRPLVQELKQRPHYTMRELGADGCSGVEVSVSLPGVESAAGVDLDVGEKTLLVDCPGYELELKLPAPVDEERVGAKFDKAKQVLRVTLWAS